MRKNCAHGPLEYPVMTDWKAVAAAIAPDIPAEQIEKVAPLLDAMRARCFEQTSRIGNMTEPCYIQAVQEIEK